MTKRRTAAVVLLCLLVVTIPASRGRLLAEAGNRLTGRGTAVFTVMSGGQTSRDALFTVNFTATQDAAGTWSGNIRLAPAFGAVRVTIDATDYLLERISADVFEADVDFSAPSAYLVAGPGTIEVADAAGQQLFFQGKLKVNGAVGGPGAAIAFDVTVEPRGDRGEIGGTGSWKSGTGATTDIGVQPLNRNGLLKGLYSGELHGYKLGQPYAAVFVIGFDGNGGITGGRISNGGQHLPIVPAFLQIEQSTYSVDNDGFGTLSFITLINPNQVSGSDGVTKCRIAVGDGGKIVKVDLYRFFHFAPLQDEGWTIVGDLVRQ